MQNPAFFVEPFLPYALGLERGDHLLDHVAKAPIVGDEKLTPTWSCRRRREDGRTTISAKKTRFFRRRLRKVRQECSDRIGGVQDIVIEKALRTGRPESPSTDEVSPSCSDAPWLTGSPNGRQRLCANFLKGHVLDILKHTL